MSVSRRCALLLLALPTPVEPARAQDWPGFLGPRRAATSPETGLRTGWPAKGPPVAWEKEVGEGYSGPVVADGRLVLFHRVQDDEVVACLDAATGKEQWKLTYPTSFDDDFGKGNGPRATPLLAGGRVYTLGAEGTLHCLDLHSGKVIWKRALAKDYQPPHSFFGVGSSPILEGDLLLVNVGARQAGIVALHKDTGKEVWRATGDGASYSSPVVATLGGVRRAVFFTRQGVVLLEPKTGRVAYQKRWRSRSEASVNAATPVVVGDLVFVSAAYETGALLLRVGADGVREVWSGDDSLTCHYNTPVHYQGHLYGIDGRQESGARLRCIELETGKVKWTREGFGCASLVRVGGDLLAFTEKGDLVVVAATPREFQEKARAPVLGATPCRAEMALAAGRLYVRDRRKLVCYDLRKNGSTAQ